MTRQNNLQAAKRNSSLELILLRKRCASGAWSSIYSLQSSLVLLTKRSHNYREQGIRTTEAGQVTRTQQNNRVATSRSEAMLSICMIAQLLSFCSRSQIPFFVHQCCELVRFSCFSSVFWLCVTEHIPKVRVFIFIFTYLSFTFFFFFFFSCEWRSC